MSGDVKQILEDALKLPAEARAALAGTLIESLEDPVDEDAEQKWATEVTRRLGDLDSGSISTVPWAEARRMILHA